MAPPQCHCLTGCDEGNYNSPGDGHLTLAAAKGSKLRVNQSQLGTASRSR
jgi:hypothetical protein